MTDFSRSDHRKYIYGIYYHELIYNAMNTMKLSVVVYEPT